MSDGKIAKKGRIHEKKSYFLLPILAFFVFLPSVWAQTADDLSSALARAQEARKKAMDFEGNLYFPSEWEAAEGLHISALLMSNNNRLINESISTFIEAADAFDRLSELAIPLYAQAREDEIMAIRDYLITLEAREEFPEYLLDADRTAVQAFTLYEAKDFYSARDSAAKALKKYNVLETAFNSWLLRVEIQDRGFKGFNPDTFELGGEIISGAMEAYMAGDLEAALEKAEEALSTYDLMLSTAWASYAGLRSSLAEAERLAALDMKSDIAAKEFFKIADSDYKAALDLLESKQYEDAAKLFINAEAMFGIAGITTLEKRRTAAEAFDEGDYDLSAGFANEAAWLSKQSDVYVAITADGAIPSPNVLPATYTVQSWSVSKDCFWNIAGQPWAYGNPHYWTALYNANKSKLPDPNNPDILEPGIVLDIPSIQGEIRQGAWESGKAYEPIR